MKQHFKILDGLRGVAAFCVVFYHATVSTSKMPHSYLAVDFFFMLSGYVISYAYDDGLTSSNILRFIKVRIIRLHPLAVIGTLLGILCFFFNPYQTEKINISSLSLIITIIVSLLILPSQSPDGKFYFLFPFNNVMWSLFSEYFINIVYAYLKPKISVRGLKLIVALSALLLFYTAIKLGGFGGVGWNFESMFFIPIRVTFPFLMGALLNQLKYKFEIRFPFLILSLVLIGVFHTSSLSSGFYDASMIIFIFPLIIIIASSSKTTTLLAPACDFLGKLSYPIYVLHYPLIKIYTSWVLSTHYDKKTHMLVGLFLIILIAIFSSIMLRFFDEPIRKWLNSKLNK